MTAVFRWLERLDGWLTALTCGHEQTRLRASDNRIWLECLRCGWESRGWTVDREAKR